MICPVLWASSIWWTGGRAEPLRRNPVYIPECGEFQHPAQREPGRGQSLLPLPALDGGRLVFILIEIIRGKPIAREKEGMVHAIGILLLMALMVFVLFNDVLRIIG